MPGRSYVGSNGYRYGFNGKENDNEVKGQGKQLDFGARMYDPRIGRWLSLDPLQAKYPDLSPYNFVDNSPLMFIDPDGKRIDRANSEGLREFRHNLRQTPTGRDVWREMKRSKTLITIIVKEELLAVRQGPNNYNLVEGVTVNFDLVAKGADSYYKSSTIYVSKSAYFLGQKLDEAKSEGERNAIVQSELHTGDYKVYGVSAGPAGGAPPNGILATPVLTSVSVTNNPFNGQVKVSEPNPYESEGNYMNRVATHEGNHAVWDAKIEATTLAPLEKENLKENKSYKREQNSIDQQPHPKK